MRLVSNAIPTTFTRLDETTMDEDRFIDVRTQQLLRSNHSALVAYGPMRPVFADSIPWLGMPSQPDGWAGVTDPHLMPALYHTPVMLTPNVRKCKLRIQAALSNALEVGFYSALSSLTLDNRVLSGITTSTTAKTWYTVDLTVPHRHPAERGRQLLMFSLWITLREIGADILGSPVNLFDAANTYVAALNSSVSSVGIGDIIYFPSNVNIEPRIIQDWETYSSGGSTYRRFHISDKMEWLRYVPEATTPDTMKAKHGNVITIYDVQLYEYPVSGNWPDLEARI